MEDGSVSVRYRSGKEESMPLAAFVAHVQEMVHTKSLEGAGHLRR
jgi:threonyl-tRNA synthetase